MNQNQATATTSGASATSNRKPAPTPLVEGCTCDESISISGTCGHCAAAGQLGVQPKLSVALANDRFEREADRIADMVIDNDAPRRSAPIVVTSRPAASVSPKQPPTVVGAADGDFALNLERAKLRGTPLNRSMLGMYEPRFGHDLTGVREHDDAVSHRLSDQIGAKAFTHGQHIFYGRGQRNEGSTDGLRLRAHELAHTLQQRSTSTTSDPIQRTPTETDSLEQIVAESEGGTELRLVVSSNPDTAAVEEGSRFLHDKQTEVSTGVEVLPGDLIVVFVSGHERPTWDWPAGDLEVVRRVDDQAVLVRVTTDPSSVKDSKPITARLTLPSFESEVTVQLTVRSMPTAPDIVNPDLEKADDAVAEATSKRRNARREFFDKPRKERRAGRKNRRAERAKLRRELRAAKAERKGLEDEAQCSLKEQRLIQDAVTEAAKRTSQAISILSVQEEVSPEVAAALQRAFNLDASTTAENSQAVITQSRDILTLARNSMLLYSFRNFRCPTTCIDDDAGASSDRLHRMQKPGLGSPHGVTVCPRWVANRVRSAVPSKSSSRAYALLHEFVHISGPGAEPEKYLIDSDWSEVATDEALTMADAHASFAWLVTS